MIRSKYAFIFLMVLSRGGFIRGYIHGSVDKRFFRPSKTFGLKNYNIHTLRAVQQDEEQTTTSSSSTITSTSTINEAARLRKEAEMMRLQAEKMDLSLTLQKIETLENKLQNKAWIAKYPEKEADLKAQLQRLNDKLLKKDSPSTPPPTLPATKKSVKQITSLGTSVSNSERTIEKITVTTESSRNDSLEPKNTKKGPKIDPPPLAGFDEEDLALYIPIANEINAMMPNSTIEERLETFRSAPELQAHFQAKIQKMLVGPLEEMQRLEQLKTDYLRSSSSTERDGLKREIDRLEKSIEQSETFAFSDSVLCDGLIPLTEEDLARRVEAISALPDILIAIYKQRTILKNMKEEDSLELLIQMDYYEPQIQLLEQVRAISPLPDDMREDFFKAFECLPKPVQERYATNLGLEAGSTADQVLESLLEDSKPFEGILDIVKEVNAGVTQLPEYNDIEFLDRSRYLEEFFPAIGRMEGESHPSLEDVQIFSNKVLDKKSFMVTNKPERVAGGYYIRGTNLLSDEEDGSKTGNEKLVAKVIEDLEKSSLADKLDFFYILDPSPPTDEEVELGRVEKPIFVVTKKNNEKLYARASPLTKTVTSLAGFLAMFLFSIGSCALNPAISERIDNDLEAAASTGVIDLGWLAALVFPLFLSLCAIQIAHEMGHRIVAAIYKFDIGFPNLIPSITTGITGAITPLRSPPPSSKAMFDFGISGPLLGLFTSFALLVIGLDLTASMELNTQLPVVPVDLVRSSSLGGGLVRYFLGSGAAMPDQGPFAMVQLHPYAIAGLIGSITNALAMLPLGHTDGGRVSLAMFGRRGAFVVKLFTTLILCVAGLFGLDDVNIFLTYVLFVSIWQRELETPARNEVDELDFPRGLLAITGAILVGLVLIPMF